MNEQFKPPSGSPAKASNQPPLNREFAELSSLIQEQYPEKPESELTDETTYPNRQGDIVLPPTPKKARSCLLVGLGLLILIIGAAIGGWLWFKSTLNTPVEHNAEDIITVKQGMSTQAIIAELAKIGIVKNPRLLTTYLRVTGNSGQLRSGDYKFKSPISPMEAIAKIQRGEVVHESVTIPEGSDRFDIAKILATKTGKATEAEFLQLMQDTRLIRKIAPEAQNLEGYLFPDTYNYNVSTSAKELIEVMVRRFEEVFTPEWQARARALGFSVHKALTLASVVEEEARVAEDRAKISSVIHNRLKIGMPLACDPTFIYAAKVAGDYDGNPNQPRHRERRSPYNTYIYAGLPPGPIASPGRASIEAALYPANTDYLYFVANGVDGRHIFSTTGAQHSVAVEEYRRNLREQKLQ
ncbi:MAG: endolytic transglycosylase MltG [Acidobacteriota bacterium]